MVAAAHGRAGEAHATGDAAVVDQGAITHIDRPDELEVHCDRVVSDRSRIDAAESAQNTPSLCN